MSSKRRAQGSMRQPMRIVETQAGFGSPQKKGWYLIGKIKSEKTLEEKASAESDSVH
jgi:hypothetical protein